VAAIAIRLAATRPERVDQLVLVNPIAFDEVPAADIESLQRNTGRFAFRVSRGILGAAPLMRELLAGSVSDPANMPDALIARYLAPYVGKEGLEHLLLLARAVDGEDMDEVELHALPQPTTIIWGDQDRWVGPRLADRLVETLHDVRLVRLPAVGRLVPEEAPETLANLILEAMGARVAV